MWMLVYGKNVRNVNFLYTKQQWTHTYGKRLKAQTEEPASFLCILSCTRKEKQASTNVKQRIKYNYLKIMQLNYCWSVCVYVVATDVNLVFAFIFAFRTLMCLDRETLALVQHKHSWLELASHLICHVSCNTNDRKSYVCIWMSSNWMDISVPIVLLLPMTFVSKMCSLSSQLLTFTYASTLNIQAIV